MSTTAALHPADLDRLRTERPEAVVVDVRSPGEFAGRHIPGSANVPLHLLTADQLPFGDAPLVLVCESGHRARLAQAQLSEAGLVELHVLDGGVSGWEAHGLPVARLEGEAPTWALERQVRLVAGGIVASAVAASVVWPPARFLAGAVGTGLVVAAVSDTCAMGSLLARLPYNNRRPAACQVPAGPSRGTSNQEVAA